MAAVMEELAVANAMPCLQYGSKALMSVLCRVCRNIHLLCALCPSRVCCKRVSSFVTDARAHETKATTAPRTARSRRRRRRTSVRRYPTPSLPAYSPAPRTPLPRLVMPAARERRSGAPPPTPADALRAPATVPQGHRLTFHGLPAQSAQQHRARASPDGTRYSYSSRIFTPRAFASVAPPRRNTFDHCTWSRTGT